MFTTRTFKTRIILPLTLLAALSLSSAASEAAAVPGGGMDISKTPAYELLSALDLLNVAEREGLAVEKKVERPDSSSVVRITLSSKEVPALRERGRI